MSQTTESTEYGWSVSHKRITGKLENTPVGIQNSCVCLRVSSTEEPGSFCSMSLKRLQHRQNSGQYDNMAVNNTHPEENAQLLSVAKLLQRLSDKGCNYRFLHIVLAQNMRPCYKQILYFYSSVVTVALNKISRVSVTSLKWIWAKFEN